MADAAFLSNDIIKTQFEYIGFNSETPIPAQYKTSAAILQWILENKWKLAPTDKDMVVMMHEIEYALDAKKYLVQSSMVQKGKLAASAFALESALNNVDLPTFGSPTMPHCNAINLLL